MDLSKGEPTVVNDQDREHDKGVEGVSSMEWLREDPPMLEVAVGMLSTSPLLAQDLIPQQASRRHWLNHRAYEVGASEPPIREDCHAVVLLSQPRE